MRTPLAESFGHEVAIVEVTSDTGAAMEIWLALAKPNQALTLVLAAIPEGWTAQILPAVLSEKQQRTFKEVNLRPVKFTDLEDAPSSYFYVRCDEPQKIQTLPIAVLW